MERFYYRLRPILVNAVQATGLNPNEIITYVSPNAVAYIEYIGDSLREYKKIRLYFGDEIHTVNIDDWIVKGIGNEPYILKDETFRALFKYEKTVQMF